MSHRCANILKMMFPFCSIKIQKSHEYRLLPRKLRLERGFTIQLNNIVVKDKEKLQLTLLKRIKVLLKHRFLSKLPKIGILIVHIYTSHLGNLRQIRIDWRQSCKMWRQSMRQNFWMLRNWCFYRKELGQKIWKGRGREMLVTNWWMRDLPKIGR